MGHSLHWVDPVPLRPPLRPPLPSPPPAHELPGHRLAGRPAATICRDNPWCRSLVAVEVDSREAARARVREVAAAGVDAVKAVYDGSRGLPRIADGVLAAIAEEANRQQLPLIVHATSVDAMLTVVALGADRLVHPSFDRILDNNHAGSLLRDRGVPISTTVFGSDRALANLRRLWDDGATVAYGTDTPQLGPAQALQRETDSLSRVFTPEEIITALTRNAASFLALLTEIGTLEPGKVADILIVDGDPLSDIAALANVVIVVKDGAVVVDNR